ncbi:MAG: CRISPR-associated endonuclease Cas2 [Candidatus Pacebacteria bacterium]|jgi:CRISPR-associated protein Cas2|nr:CRISPR-associated endonuclease Cas2 [Candidatus Paceibacterota bacterium]MDD2796730.1 CRISPR-associated endonuclease Cas2 [Candidatus Paceibacterota bacterium]MDD3047771.1 CRISPR-associated endonuclease Cas2 [Candidatus Paceibacterota bacterium]MDD3509743.1 CRISPR-associated endonuclease Cas2 [Candidatus Paceibacterota bacterium]MDD3918668.1 CRISPR-associated endonuclease Cas2 [Candidatus Paceibacterota bacterium]
MFIISYDFSNNKQRSNFAKFLKKYGRRIQFSVYEIRNSKRFLNNILKEIDLKYKKTFTKRDSIVIIQICNGCKAKIVRYGYAENENREVLFFKKSK